VVVVVMHVDENTRSRRRGAAPPDRAALASLGRSFRGHLIGPGSSSYEERRRVWNGSIDRRPALIARCSDPADVAAALAYGRRTGLPIAVRGGGHSFAGHSVCDDGVVIDLSQMKRIAVDPRSRTVDVQAGVVLGELDRATQTYGLAVPIGSVTHTGIAGLTLGGGIGWLMRRHGLTIDQLSRVRLITPDGQMVVASAEENGDLFWGLRGGGGNFGIATDLRFRLVEVGPMVFSGVLVWPLEAAPEIVDDYRAWAAASPDDLTTALVLRRAPAVDLFPEELHGRPVVGIAYCWSGSPEDGERALEPMRRRRPPAADLSAIRPFVDHQALFDASFPDGLWVYSKAADVRALTDDVVHVLLDHAAQLGSARSVITIWQLGGAVARIDADDTAFGSRRSGHLIDALGATDSAEGFDRERDWAMRCWSALVPHQVGAYVNWLMADEDDAIERVYGSHGSALLRDLKRRYDPTNVFRLNHNIRPG
jgi:hypothetical protein